MWSVETLNEVVTGEITSLPDDIRARLVRYTEQIEALGPQGLPPKAFKFLGDRLWELRLQGRDGIGRAIYVTAFERRVVIVRAFVKKTQKTSPAEIRLARDRARMVP